MNTNSLTALEFTSLAQAAIFTVGRLNGLSGTTRYELDPQLVSEIEEIAKQLKDSITRFDQ